ncbi:MAG: MCE family protein [Fibrobacter sp.]|nr:MCE family protein [Fibrobacter sp.]
MKISDRTLGYLSLVVLLLVFGIIAFCMWDAHHVAKQTIMVDFDELGSLQPEDQVVVRGYTVGSVGSVKWLGNRARVEINFNEPVIIREGTQFSNINYALMGQRRIEITLSKKGKVLPDSHVHTGIFEPGVAEALKLIENVNDQLIILQQMINILVEGDSVHASASAMLETMMATIENALQSVQVATASLEPSLNYMFNKADSATSSLVEVTMQADTVVHKATDVLEAKLNAAEKFIVNVSNGVKQTDQIITDIENSPLTLQFLETTETLDKVNTLITKFNSLIQALNSREIKIYDENGNRVRLITWKRLNIIGKTAREKAKERAEAEQQKGN